MRAISIQEIIGLDTLLMPDRLSKSAKVGKNVWCAHVPYHAAIAFNPIVLFT